MKTFSNLVGLHDLNFDYLATIIVLTRDLHLQMQWFYKCQNIWLSWLAEEWKQYALETGTAKISNSYSFYFNL